MRILITGRHGFLARHFLNHAITYLKASSPNYSIFYYSYRNHSISLLHGSNDEHYPNEFDLLLDIGSPTPLNSSNTADVYRRHIEDVCQIYDKYSFSRVIFTSSVSVFDYYSTGLISEYSEPRPSSDYSSLKIELEKLHFRNNSFAEVHYLSALCGKSMPSTFLKKCIYTIRQNELPKVNSLSDYFNGAYPVNLYASFLLERISAPFPDRAWNQSKFLICSHSAIEWGKILEIICTHYHANELNSTIHAQIHSKALYKRLFYPINFTPIYSMSQTLSWLLHCI